jgi:cysteine synthase A
MHGSILDTIGTPLVQIDSPEGATVAAKLESFNPGGSAKDRPALAMIEAAEREGLLEPGESIVEPTSGNTGIGLGIAAAARGYDLTIVLPDTMSAERRRLLRAYGATIELVSGEMTDARERADEIVEETGAIQLGQFENPANAEAHYRTTAPEIIDAVNGREIDALVAGVGTGGTITGTGQRLKEEFPEMEVIAVEPETNAVLSTGTPGKDEYQGMGAGFVSELMDVGLLDSIETVALAEAENECRRLAREEGILVGQSSGAASVASRRVAERLAQPELNCPEAPELQSISADGGLESGYDDCPLVVTIFPDSGERYLSTGLFD